MNINDFLEKFAQPSCEQLKVFSALLSKTYYENNKYFVKAGDIHRKAAFVQDGLFRLYYLDHRGKEYTKNFMQSGSLISPLNSLLRGQPSNLYIQALKESTLLEIDFDDWLKLVDSHICWQIAYRKILEQAYLEKEKRETDLLVYNAARRYANFLREFPDLVKYVKQHHIASFLGMSPETLSRIKSKNDKCQ